MDFIVYFNYIAMGLIYVIIAAAALIKTRRPFPDRFNKIIFSRKFEVAFIAFILVISALLRIYDLGNLPAGMNQDEASIGYDSFALANYGVDRNGYHFPVYPVAWGAGHGPFYMYITVLFFKIFGESLFIYRLPQALLGVLSVLVFYLLLKRITDRFSAYVGALLITVSPWHIMGSRWGLDANPAPFMVLFAIYFFVKGCQDKKTRSFIFSGALFSLSLYTYASTYIAVPIMLIILVTYALVRRYINIKQLIYTAYTCIVVALPLALFWIINLFNLQEIRTPFFSIPRLTALRSESIFLAFDKDYFHHLFENIGNLVTLLYSYPAPEVFNVVKGFNIIYVFTFPLLILGLALSIRRAIKLKSDLFDFVMVAWFIGSFIFSLNIHMNINRVNILFIPVIYFVVMGIKFIAGRQKELCALVLSLVIAASGLFATTYYTDTMKMRVGFLFMHGLGEAAQYADSLDKKTVYCVDLNSSDRTVNGAYLILMFYCKIDPKRFYETVEYYEDDAEFRFPKHFDRYNFELPINMGDIKYKDDVFILPRNYEEDFDSHFDIVHFDRFIVVTRER